MCLDVETIIPTPFALEESMRNVAKNAILTICERNHISPADLLQLANQLAQREATADSKTGALNVHCYTRN